MLGYIRAELLKIRGTFFEKLLIIAPLLFIVYALITRRGIDVSGAEMMEQIYTAVAFNWWPLIMLPMGAAILAMLERTYEKRAGDFRFIFSTAANRRTIWYAKNLVVCLAMIITSLLFGLCVSGVVVVFYGDASRILTYLSTALMLGVSACAFAPLHLFLAHRFAPIVSILVGVAGLISGVFAAQHTLWFLDPYAIPFRISSAMLAIHPNGTIITDPSSPLLSLSALPVGLFASVAFGLILTVAGSWWFSRTEV